MVYRGYREIIEKKKKGENFELIKEMMIEYEKERRIERMKVGMEKEMVNERMIYEVMDIEKRKREIKGEKEMKEGKGEIRLENIYL